MNEVIEKFEVRDFRTKEFFQIDDAYLNGFARLCGIYATGVYLSLCRHANKTQTSFPSVKLISEELAISEDSVTKAIKILTEHKIIHYERKRANLGVFLSTVYVLLDKRHWTTATHSAVSGMDIHSVDNGMDRGYTHPAVSGTKYTQRLKDTQKRKKLKKEKNVEESKEQETKSPSQLGLSPCTYEEQWEIAKHLNIPLEAVQEKHVQIMEMIEEGYFQTKYKKLKTVYFTLRNWLRMDKSKGMIEELDEFGVMALEGESPEERKKMEEAKEQMRLMGKL